MEIICHNGEQVKTVSSSIKDKLDEKFIAVLSDNAANPMSVRIYFNSPTFRPELEH
jgi:hypothetical protein